MFQRLARLCKSFKKIVRTLKEHHEIDEYRQSHLKKPTVVQEVDEELADRDPHMYITYVWNNDGTCSTLVKTAEHDRDVHLSELADYLNYISSDEGVNTTLACVKHALFNDEETDDFQSFVDYFLKLRSIESMVTHDDDLSDEPPLIGPKDVM